MKFSEVLETKDFIDLGTDRILKSSIIRVTLGCSYYGNKKGAKVTLRGIYGSIDGQTGEFGPDYVFYAEGTPECDEIYQFFSYEPEQSKEVSPEEKAEQSFEYRSGYQHSLSQQVNADNLKQLSSRALTDFYAGVKDHFIQCYFADIKRICDAFRQTDEVRAAISKDFPHLLFSSGHDYDYNYRHYFVKDAGNLVFSNREDTYVPGSWVSELRRVIEVLEKTEAELRVVSDQNAKDKILYQLTGAKQEQTQTAGVQF